ncbi:oxidoreductase [Salsipaludibacter albus]|uniref:oxidoreductase n=1 Tax=Salsipaludibacter albus TaxID=2849650 RepID=UPI001EE4B511|nr:oxidoreductase [Salsipaludibacter albus]MBY5160959.1 SDR family oxidoreductase [Salsipaludibacter albus]
MGWTTGDMPAQRGRTAVVTGATSGLGRSTVVALARAGATVVLATRDPDKTASVMAEVRAGIRRADLHHVHLDLADLSSVRTAADDLHDRFERLDLLVNNAGVMNTPLQRTADGFELQFGVNHLGHFALTGLVVDLLADAADPRVVTVSSGAARIGRIRWDDPNWESGRYWSWPAYAQSKLANQLFALELHRRLRAARSPIASLAAHPGFAATDLQERGPRMRGGVRARLTTPLMRAGNALFAQNADMGALPQLFAGTAPTAASGHYYGPDGAFEQRGTPTEVDVVPAARDRADGRRLWELSEHLTGVAWDLPDAASSVGAA